MTKGEFVEMLTIMHSRTRTGEVLAYRYESDVGSNEVDTWGSILIKAFGRLCVDDSGDPVTREDGKSHTPLYPLDEIDTWPEGLFEKLSGYIWWLDPEDEINILDVIEQQTRT